jgi:hypothetical protein
MTYCVLLIVCKIEDLKRGRTLFKYNTELWNLTSISKLWHFIYILSFKQISFLVSEIFKYMLKFRIFSKSILTFKCDLDLKLAKGWHGFCTYLVEVNIWAKIEENLSISVRLTERTRHTVFYLIVWYLTFNNDHDIELTHEQHGFCIPPCWIHLSQVWRKSIN